MTKYKEWQFEDDPKPTKSYKQRLDKHKYCKKNRIGKNKYGPHVYGEDGKYCVKCGHIKKERKRNYGYE